MKHSRYTGSALPRIVPGSLLCGGLLFSPAAMLAAPPDPVLELPVELTEVGLRSQRGERTIAPSADEGAKAAAAPREWLGRAPWREWSRATGDWGGVRSRLEDLGFGLGADYTLDWSAALGGGLRRRGVARGLLAVEFSYDPKPLLGIEGGKLFAQYFFRHGPNGSDDIGDLQGYSNIDAERLSKAEEFWYEQSLLSDRLRVKVGQVDANSEFAYLDSAGEFLSSSAGYSTTILDLPTYPYPRLSLNAFAYATTNLYVGVGVYGETAEDGGSFSRPFEIFEVGYTKPATARLGAGRVAVGGWHSSATFDTFAGGRETGASGAYAVAEQQLWREEPGNAENEQGLTLFAQYGYADREIGAVAHHVSAGLRYQGLLPGRDGDSAGLRYSHAVVNRAAGAAFDADEYGVEAYYRLRLTKCLSVQPDLQWIRNPGGSRAEGEAWVGSLRFGMTF